MFSMPHSNTNRVYLSTPRVDTICVESHVMKTIGERIRQAREALKMSGEALALKVGYKNQSAIGNLENRVSGNGGNRIVAIAAALNVPIEWLLKGPDDGTIPFLSSPAAEQTGQPLIAAEPQKSLFPLAPKPPLDLSGLDPWTREAVEIMSRLKEHEKQGAIANLRTYVHNLGPPRDGQALPVAA